MPKDNIWKRNWELFTVSWGALRQRPRLLVFPVLGMISLILGMIAFLTIVTLTRWAPPETLNSWFFLYPFAMAIPLPLMLFTSLAHAGFYYEAMRALAGGEISVRRGFRAAWGKIGELFAWQLFAGLIVQLLNLIGGKLGIGARLAAVVTGIGWSAASFFVVPIIMRDAEAPRDPIELLRRSIALVRANWGETITGMGGLGLLSAITIVPFLAAGLVFRNGWEGLSIAMGWGLGAAVVAAAIWQFAVIAAGDLFRCALYIYATEGVVPGPFTQAQLDASWRVGG